MSTSRRRFLGHLAVLPIVGGLLTRNTQSPAPTPAPTPVPFTVDPSNTVKGEFLGALSPMDWPKGETHEVQKLPVLTLHGSTGRWRLDGKELDAKIIKCRVLRVVAFAAVFFDFEHARAYFSHDKIMRVMSVPKHVNAMHGHYMVVWAGKLGLVKIPVTSLASKKGLRQIKVNQRARLFAKQYSNARYTWYGIGVKDGT